MPETEIHRKEIQQAFVEYDRQVTISNFKVACVLGMILMPVGYLMDRHMYAELAGYFLKLRLLSSVLIAIFLAILLTPLGRKYYRFQGVTLFMVPASIIAWMIYKSPEGAASPYYAGLNLVMLPLAFVLHWTFRESFIAALLLFLLYLAASFFHGGVTADIGGFATNLFFLGSTAVVVVTGSYFYSKSRFREFAFRYELDKNKKALEENNQKLDRQNSELANTLQKLTEAESQLVQSEKMASLGVMSAGIIHEINNPLNYATTGLYSLRQKGKHLAPEQQADFADILKDVEEGVSRVKNIVSDLRMFTHPSTDSCDQVEVAEVVEPSLRFLSNELKDKVCIEQQWPEHQTVTANKQKLIHVLTNLLHNSLDALKSKTFTDEKPTIWIGGCVENGRSLLTIRDNGPGIESQHLNKIFDPFFTTKDVGAGMGLGLSICYRIMQESGGRISVKTEPGKFCEFTLEFPAKG
jgi:two-component system sensor histidine kinase PhcS